MDNAERDDLAALDFSAETGPDRDPDSDAFDFSAPAPEEDAAVEALDEFAPELTEEVGSELAALDDDDDEDDDDELDPFTCTVTNPPGTVAVSALIDGSVRQIDLSPGAAKMTESQLTEEILVLAHLAQQKGLAGQHDYLMHNEIVTSSMSVFGADGQDVMRRLVEDGMGLPTPEQAAAEEAEVFAVRYAGDND